MPPPARGWMREAQTGVIGVSLTLPTSHGAHCLSGSALRMFVSTSVSRRRNPASPSSAKISAIVRPSRSSITLSRSIKRQQSSSESLLPTLLLPHPINPIRLIIIFVCPLEQTKLCVISWDIQVDDLLYICIVDFSSLILCL